VGSTGTSVRVLTVAQGWPGDRPGGLNRYVADLHAGLVARGVDATTVVFGPARDRPPGVHLAGGEDRSLPRRLLAVVRAARARSDGATVLATHFALYGLLPALLPPLRALPLVVHFHGPWADESRVQGAGVLSRAVKAGVERLHYRRARLVVTASQAFADLVVASYGVAPERVHVAHPGVDVRRFSPVDDERRTALRAALGVAPGDLLVVTARRLVPRTGVDVLLRAWPAAPGRHLVVVGDGPDRPALERLAAGLPGVRFTGRVDDEELVDLYRAADVAVVPSLALEGFGLVVLEALACGTPVLASDLGGLGEVLPALGDGLLLRPGDVDELRRRLEAAAAGDLPGRGACAALAAQWSLDAFAARVADLYDLALGARP
jgi:glycosyltransferase involved in cell wall biosynthesis